GDDVRARAERLDLPDPRVLEDPFGRVVEPPVDALVLGLVDAARTQADEPPVHGLHDVSELRTSRRSHLRTGSGPPSGVWVHRRFSFVANGNSYHGVAWMNSAYSWAVFRAKTSSSV